MASNDSDPSARGARRPVIGLTTYLEQAKQGVWDVRAAFLPQQYFTSVTSSGGIAVLLPPQDGPDDAAAAVLDTLDGLILTGGLDVQPELYGADRHPLTDPARPDRDAWELALLRGAEERGIPVLAICRGLQLANVAHGGTLHQHLPEALGTERGEAVVLGALVEGRRLGHEGQVQLRQQLVPIARGRSEHQRACHEA